MFRRAISPQLQLRDVEGYQGSPSPNPSSEGSRRGATTPFWQRPGLNAPLRADLGCSSSYSIAVASALNLMENRSVEKDFLPTAVEQE